MEQVRLSIGGRSIALFPGERPGSPLVLINGESGEGERVLKAAHGLCRVDFSMASIEGVDWNDELSPWPCEAVFRGGAAFGGHADRYLMQLTDELLPEIVRALPQPPAYVALAGYSLAGLFAVYATYRTSAFARVASASGSLWYPGFPAFAEGHEWARRPDRAYLSLGDREARTRNAAMHPVEVNTRRLAELWDERGAKMKLEMNPGGHFDEPDMRLARAVAWMIGG